MQICNKVKNMTKIEGKLTLGWIRKVDNHIINIMIKAWLVTRLEHHQRR